MNNHTAKKVSTKQVWSYVFTIAKTFPLGIFSMFLAVFSYAIGVSLNPYLIKTILNRIVQSNTQNLFVTLTWPIAGYLTVCVLHIFTYRLYNYLVSMQTIPQMRTKIANYCFEKLLSKNQTFFQDHLAGTLAGKINDLAYSVPDLLKTLIEQFFSHALTTIIAIATLWQVNSIFALLMIGWNLFCIALMMHQKNNIANLAYTWSKFGSIITGKAVDSLANILSVRLFAGQTNEKACFNNTLQEAIKAEQKLEWTYLKLWLWYSLATIIVQVLNLYFLCSGIQKGWLTVGDFPLVLAINVSIFDLMWFLAEHVSRFSTLYGKVAQALTVILDPSEIQDKPNALDLKISHGEIKFVNVHFGYKDQAQLFTNKQLTIKAGQKIGLVGYSGGGKTTFINLILKLYNLDAGQILIDGQNIDEINQNSLHKQISVIPQDVSLFHRTLLDNIRYGNMGATDDQVIAAAKKADAHDFIINLPQGYQTLVGDHGVKLSGGQRQRIAIARAILKDAPILILDEATSQLDSLTEGHIQENLWTLMNGRTTIIIAHRLSTLLDMDRILVFDQGKIIADGTHNQLVNQEGLYQKLWNTQANNFAPHNKTL